jgi:hypothetical protein
MKQADPCIANLSYGIRQSARSFVLGKVNTGQDKQLVRPAWDRP